MVEVSKTNPVKPPDIILHGIDKGNLEGSLQELFTWLDGVIRDPNGAKDEILSALQGQYPDAVAKARQRLEKQLKIDELISFAKEKPDTSFALGLAGNPNYTPDEEAIRFAKEKPDTSFALGLAENPNYTPDEEAIRIAKEKPDTWFARGLARNKNLLAI